MSSKGFCKYCKRDLSRLFYIQCAECENDLLLCGDCFSVGVEINESEHKNNHKYIVADCLETPLFTKDWSMNEELLLLDGIERYGVGNWKLIAEHLFQPNKTTKQVEEHYWELYMGVHGHCLPKKTFDKNGILIYTSSFFKELLNNDVILEEFNTNTNILCDDSNSSSSELQQQDILYHIPVQKGYTFGEVVRRDAGKEYSKTKDKQISTVAAAQVLPGADLAGYIPLRGDFDYEYENDAEKMLSEMEFGVDEHPSEKELKLQVIKIYNHKLQERNKRKDFVIERGLVDCKAQQIQDRRRTKDDRELVGKLKVFARFQSKEEHDALVDSVLKARKLRNQIELCSIYRQAGLRTLEDVRQYESAKKLREKDLKVKKHRDSAPYLFNNNDNNNDEYNNTNSYNVSDDLTTKSSSSLYRSRRSRGGGDSENDLLQIVTAETTTTNTTNTTTSSSSSRGRKMAKISSNNNIENTTGKFLTNYTNTSSNTIKGNSIESGLISTDLAKAPGGDLLSELELNLCVAIPLLPLHYLAAKDAIVREAYRNGSLTQNGVNRTLKLDTDKTKKIFDFFVKELYINGKKKN